MKKFLLCLLLSLLTVCSVCLFAVGTPTVNAEDSEKTLVKPIINWELNDVNNPGKDKMGNQDLVKYIRDGSVTLGADRGMKLKNNTLYARADRENLDFSDYLDTFSLSLWFKPESSGTSRILCSGNYSILDGFVLIYEYNGTNSYLYMDMYSEEGLNGEPGSSGHFTYRVEIENPNEWHFFGMSIDSETKHVYYVLDNKVVGDFYYKGKLLMANSWQSFSLYGLTHTNGGGHTDFFNGYIDDVRIYDVALSDTDLLNLKPGEDLYITTDKETVEEIVTGENTYYLNSEIPASYMYNVLPKTLTVKGNKGSEIQSEIDWYHISKTGNTGIAYGFIHSYEMLNTKGKVAAINLEFNQTEQIPLILAPVFDDNVVLQRNGCNFYGRAGNTSVTVTVEGYEPVTTECNNGDWEVWLDLDASATPLTVTVETGKGEKTVLRNVLIGEVWYCSGQSNMDYNVQQMTGFTRDMLRKADYSNIHFMKRSMYSSFEPYESYTEKWIAPKSVDDIAVQSAFATCFGLQLKERLKAQEGIDVPVGIISAAIGGSGIEQWMSKESIQVAGSRIDNAAGKYDTEYYYGMTYSLKNTTVAGVLWYQGEDNIYYPAMYKKQFKEYVKDMREMFDCENLPVVIVGLPQYNMIEWATFRQVQYELSQENEYVYTACLNEYGDDSDIHPTKDKWQSATRCIELACKHVYNDSMALGNSPYPENIYIENEQIIIELKDGEGLKALYNKRPDGFEVKVGGEWVKANAEILNGKIYISTSQFTGTPTSVRYFHLANTTDYESFNYVYNGKGLPLWGFELEVNAKKYLVKVESKHGTISVENNIEVVGGSTITFSITPDEGYKVVSVTQNGQSIYTNGYTVTTSTIMRDTQIVVLYEKITLSENKYYTVSINNDNEKGEVKASTEQVAENGSVSFLIVVKEGYEIDRVTVNGNKVNVVNNSFACNNVNINLQVTVTYKEITTQQGGCKSSVGGGFGLIALLLASVAVLRKKR